MASLVNSELLTSLLPTTKHEYKLPWSCYIIGKLKYKANTPKENFMATYFAPMA